MISITVCVLVWVRVYGSLYHIWNKVICAISVLFVFANYKNSVSMSVWQKKRPIILASTKTGKKEVRLSFLCGSPRKPYVLFIICFIFCCIFCLEITYSFYLLPLKYLLPLLSHNITPDVRFASTVFRRLWQGIGRVLTLQLAICSRLIISSIVTNQYCCHPRLVTKLMAVKAHKLATR